MRTSGGAFTPEGFIILSLSIPADLLTILLSILGVGLLSKIAYVFASAIFVPWQLSKLGVAGMRQKKKKGSAASAGATSSGESKIKKKIRDKIMKKFAFKAIPFVGDFLNLWTVNNYKILEGKF